MSRTPSTLSARASWASGWSEADDLVRIVLDRSSRLLATISGPGGAGKTALLDALDTSLRSEGIDVFRGFSSVTEPVGDPSSSAILVDDAEQLDDDEVSVLRAFVRDDGPHVVIAGRPWPRSDAMAELAEWVGRRGTSIAIHPLSVREMHDVAVAALGVDRADGIVGRLSEMTHGNARLVELVVAAADEQDWDPREPGPLPSGVLDRLRHELDRLDAGLLDFLLASAVGFSASGPALATAPRFAGADLRSLMSAARASGLVAADGSVLPVVRDAILQTTPAHELWPVRRELVDALEAAGLPLGGTALELAQQGFRDPRVAEALRAQADDSLPTDPVDAWRRYAASIEAGADVASLAGRRAQAAWAAGDIRAAERLVDGLLTGPDHPDLPRVMNVAAAIWARKGMLQRGADAYVALTENEGCAEAPLAAVCLAALGEGERAHAILCAAPDVEYPTSSQVAVSLMADGLLAGLEGTPDRALAALLQSSSVMNDAGEIIALPEAPAVLAAHVAMNSGELGIAADVLQSAIDAVQGGPALRNRLRLTLALVALRADRPHRARGLLEAAESSQRPLGLRDEILGHAVRIGVARRTDDIANLVRAWNAARPAIARMPVDLTALPVLAELSIAAARLHESHLVAEPVAAAWELLVRAGQPASWSTNLHWAGIQAAILRNDHEEFARHSSALADDASENRVASRLAEAGRIWTAALAGQVDVDAVERAVRDLAGAGYPWDASRLAGHAAARAPEHRDTLQLLSLARSLHPEEPAAESADEPADAASNGHREESRLSAREREVARLVLEGKTYAEIGNAIFISPRTAEHHIARIRRRLGVTTRSELLARLRLVLEDDENGR